MRVIADAQLTYKDRLGNGVFAHFLTDLYHYNFGNGQTMKFVDVSIAHASTTSVQGYFIVPMTLDDEGRSYIDQPQKFAYVAYPETYELTGRFAYIVNEHGRVYRREGDHKPMQWPQQQEFIDLVWVPAGK